MERGSSSRRSWADVAEESDDEEASFGTEGSPLQHLPPLAAAAHATIVLHSSSLNPDAEPFYASPRGSSGRLHFTDSEASLDDSDGPPPAGKGKAAMPTRRLRRRHRRRRATTSGFLADARRPSVMAPAAHLASIVVHPTRMSVEPDEDGFRQVQSRRRWRRAAGPRAPLARPVPQNLVGRGFNCLAEDHVGAMCTSPSRCFFCLGEGHQARDCPHAPPVGRGRAKRGQSPCRGLGRGVRPRRRRSRRSSWSSGTVSGRSVSTGRAPSVPPVCEPPTPDPLVDAPAVVAPENTARAGHGGAMTMPDVGGGSAVGAQGPSSGDPSRPRQGQGVPHSLLRRALHPPASPRTRAASPLLQLVVVPRSSAIQAAEDALS